MTQPLETTLHGVAGRVQSVLKLRDPEALEAALERLSPSDAALAVGLAAGLEAKSAILWGLADARRREVLDLLPSPLIAALIQNLEEDNRFLLGDLSIPGFQSLLQLCSPERQFGWLLRALSFTDVRANALPLLLPTAQLVEILLTRAEWHDHLRGLADFPIEDQRLPAEALQDPAQAMIDLYGPEGFLRQFPVQDPELAQAIQLILTYDADRYADLIRLGLQGLDYAENHPEEWETLTEAPVLLSDLDPLSDLFAGAREPFDADATPPIAADPSPPLALQPTLAGPLARTITSLPTAVRERVQADLQTAYIRQAIAEGGSFLRTDLERVARSEEAYLLLGLAAISEREADWAEVLSRRPLRKVSAVGTRIIERLRQAVLRLTPLAPGLPPRQRVLVQSLEHPRMSLTADGRPVLLLLPHRTLPPSLDVIEAAGLLLEAQRWGVLVRVIGVERCREHFQRARDERRLLTELAVSALAYGRLELGLIDVDDRRRVVNTHLSPVAQVPLPEAVNSLARVAKAWEADHGLEGGWLGPQLQHGLEWLAEEVREAAR